MHKTSGAVSNIQQIRVSGRFGIRWYNSAFLVGTDAVVLSLAEMPDINSGDKVIVVGKMYYKRNVKVFNGYAYYNYSTGSSGKGHTLWEYFLGIILIRLRGILRTPQDGQQKNASVDFSFTENALKRISWISRT